MLGISGLVKGNFINKRFHMCKLSFVLIPRKKESYSHWKRERYRGKHRT